MGAGRNPERCIVVMCNNNVDVISESNEDIATGIRQIRRFQRPHSGLKTSQQETPSNMYKWFILPETRLIDLYLRRRKCGCTSSVFTHYVWKSNPLNLELYLSALSLILAFLFSHKDVAASSTRRHAGLSIARHLAVARPKLSWRG